MGRYVDWSDVTERYDEIDTLGGADEISSTYIAYAEAFVDGILSNTFTPPFSSNNVTVKDLTIDCVYWRAGRFKLENATEVRSSFYETVDMLINGKMPMIDTSGNVIASAYAQPGAFSTTGSYHQVFGVDDPLYWGVSSAQLSDLADSRDLS